MEESYCTAIGMFMLVAAIVLLVGCEYEYEACIWQVKSPPARTKIAKPDPSCASTASFPPAFLSVPP